MGNMEGFGVFLWNAVITLFSFLAVAPIVLSAVSQFGVQKRFAQAMIDEGIISAEEVKLLQPKKQIAGVVISVIVVAALAYTCCENAALRPYLRPVRSGSGHYEVPQGAAVQLPDGAAVQDHL